MRLWSLHPRYLDARGLVALWREALLAQKVLNHRTTGYKNHPQLIRFKKLREPGAGVGTYLQAVYEESVKRQYLFNKSKIIEKAGRLKIPVTRGQLEYEFDHLKRKLRKRDRARYKTLLGIKIIAPHPNFKIVKGDIETWEIVSSKMFRKRT